jgi:hypothetical protein
MSMVFQSTKASNLFCPKCQKENGEECADGGDVECSNCRMIYQRSISWTPSQQMRSFSDLAPFKSIADIEPLDFQSTITANLLARKGKVLLDEDEDIALYRRVRIQTSIVIPAERSRQTSPANESDSEDTMRISSWMRVQKNVRNLLVVTKELLESLS